jgi:1-acyl-sn-glycerol-3-phosphate acyltransferase
VSTDPKATRPLPARPNLRHLKAQAKDLLDAGAASSIADAQFQIARLYGFVSWPKLKAHVDGLRGASTDADAAERDTLVDAIMGFLGAGDDLARGGTRAALEREIDLAGSGALVSLQARLAAATDWDFYAADPLARRILHLLAEQLVLNDCSLVGIEHAVAVSGRRVVLVANHLSYADANLIDVLLQRSGGAALAGRLTAIAGPKVFSDRLRRFSSLAFGTIKTPQSTNLSSEESVMSAREVAVAARRSIDLARARLTRGDALLVFPEGRRSRTGALQQMLVGAARYLEVPDTWILPVGIAGSDALFPIGSGALRPVRIVVRMGQPFEVEALSERAGGDRRLIMDAIGLAIAELLPKKYQGVYGDEVQDLHRARGLLTEVRLQRS